MVYTQEHQVSNGVVFSRCRRGLSTRATARARGSQEGAAAAATHLSLAPYLCRSNAVPFASVCAISFIGGGLLLALSPQAQTTAAAALESEPEPAPTTQTQVSCRRRRCRHRRRRCCHRRRRCCCLHSTIHSVTQYLARSGVWVYVRLSTPLHLDVISASLQAVSLPSLQRPSARLVFFLLLLLSVILFAGLPFSFIFVCCRRV